VFARRGLEPELFLRLVFHPNSRKPLADMPNCRRYHGGLQLSAGKCPLLYRGSVHDWTAVSNLSADFSEFVAVVWQFVVLWAAVG
jgi:hypothetical protein